MSNPLPQEIECPNCHNPIDIREHGHHVTCDACSRQFVLSGHLCYRCQTYHPDHGTICSQCDAPMSRVCHNCMTANWAGDEHCSNCGRAMDILDVLERQTSGATADRLSRQMMVSRQLKEQEELASQKRMAELMAIEEERQAALRERTRRQRRQDRQIMAGAGGVVGIFLLIIIIYLLINAF